MSILLPGPNSRSAVFAAAVAVVVAVGAGLFGPATPAGSASRAPGGSPPPTYVALGDSYTAGPAIPPQLDPGTDPAAPSACLRSGGDYPSLTARSLGYELTDVSCVGATTGDLTGSQGEGIPPQLSAVRATTSVVSVGIGGNDLGFSSIVSRCAAATPWGPTKDGWSCARHDGTGGTEPLATVLRQVGVKVAAVLDDIRQRAQRARVFVIGYPEIIPSTGPGCWPGLPFSRTDTAFLRGVEDGLNTTLARDAGAADDTYVDMATPSASHNACTPPGTRWVEPILPSPHSYPLHPSAAGMAGMAAVLESAMRSAPAP
jgi:lysophospholipase L1-like esterase